MASTAHSDPAMMQEHRDPPEVLAEKVARLVELVRGSRHFVIFTGAGISTSAGIGDFRGPNGKWTCQSQGRSVPKGVKAVSAFPTPSHMAMVELHRCGVLKYVISQNCDGLHRRSGLPADAISELHGNGNIEICEECGASFFRDFKCGRMEMGAYDHFTGRFCGCGGRLLHSCIDFGQNLPSEPLQLAEAHSREADVHLVLGSSLTVAPACNMPRTTARSNGKLVICNLQQTPLDGVADCHIFAETDTVMTMLMEHLGIPVPQFHLTRRVIAYTAEDSVMVKAVDLHNIAQEIGILRAVDWGSGVNQADLERSPAMIAERFQAHYQSTRGLNLVSLRLMLYFVGHYREPPYELRIDLQSNTAIDVILSFDPYRLEWTCTRMEALQDWERMSTPKPLRGAYGNDHKQYCVDMWIQKGGKSLAEAARIVERKAIEAREQAIAVSFALGGAGDCRMKPNLEACFLSGTKDGGVREREVSEQNVYSEPNEEMETVATNLMARFPELGEQMVWQVLKKHAGHGGTAAMELRQLANEGA